MTCLDSQSLTFQMLGLNSYILPCFHWCYSADLRTMENNPKEVFNRMGHICRLQEIFLNSLRGRMGVLSLSLYTAIRPIQVRGMVWFRLFLFAVLPRLWWEISLPNFSLMNLGQKTRGIKATICLLILLSFGLCTSQGQSFLHFKVEFVC